MLTKTRRFLYLLTLLPLTTTLVQGQDIQLKPVGTTYARAQVATWLDDLHFAVGRWDGTLTIFRTPQGGEFGPVLIFDGLTPSVQPVQMVLAVTPAIFITSNDDHSLAVWKLQDAHYSVLQVANYDKNLGIANSATQFDWQNKKWIVTGHEQGIIAIWECQGNGAGLTPQLSVSLKLELAAMPMMSGVAKPILLHNRSTARATGTRRVAINSRAAAGKLALDLETITGARVS